MTIYLVKPWINSELSSCWLENFSGRIPRRFLNSARLWNGASRSDASRCLLVGPSPTSQRWLQVQIHFTPAIIQTLRRGGAPASERPPDNTAQREGGREGKRDDDDGWIEWGKQWLCLERNITNQTRKLPSISLYKIYHWLYPFKCFSANTKMQHGAFADLQRKLHHQLLKEINSETILFLSLESCDSH